jgi:hypothetical protein
MFESHRLGMCYQLMHKREREKRLQEVEANLVILSRGSAHVTATYPRRVSRRRKSTPGMNKAIKECIIQIFYLVISTRRLVLVNFKTIVKERKFAGSTLNCTHKILPCRLIDLMSEPEIQPLIPFISRRGQVIDPLILRHRIPFSIPRPVSPNVVSLSHKIKPNVTKANRDQSTITTFVSRSIISSVYVRGDDSASLDEHVV